MVSDLPSFLKHCYIKRSQSASYEKDKEHSLNSDGYATLQMDFAENYGCVWQDEVQSAHWCKNQVTILTAVMWSKNLTQSAVVISDDNDHKKESIVTFLNELLKNILPTDITNLSIWTDGPSSQFKNRYIGVVLKWVAQNFSLSIDWNYFATSHGKGPVDGIGGYVKRFAEKVVRQRNFIISNAPEFHHAVSAIQNKNILCVEGKGRIFH